MSKETAPKPIIVKKSLKHTFTTEETAELNVRFRQAFQSLAAAEAEFESVKAVHKSKITEAEAKMTTLDATLNAGFEMREKECQVVFLVDKKLKHFFLKPADGVFPPDAKPVLIEPMTPEDFQQELLAAESAFAKRVELVLWDAGTDRGVLVVGEQGDRWFSALRLRVGKDELQERLDSEQMSFKNRYDAISRASKRCQGWLKDTLKDAGKGFEQKISDVVLTQKDKAE